MKKSKQDITFEMSSKGQHEKALSASKHISEKGKMYYRLSNYFCKRKTEDGICINIDRNDDFLILLPEKSSKKFIIDSFNKYNHNFIQK